MDRADLPSAVTVLRPICGFVFIPYSIGKLTARDKAIGFFNAADLRPAPLFSWMALATGLALAGLLLIGSWPRSAASLAFAYLVVAALAALNVERTWLWRLGGCEVFSPIKGKGL